VKKLFNFVLGRLVAGILVLAPIYLALLLLLKAVQSLGKLVLPLAKLLPLAPGGSAPFTVVGADHLLCRRSLDSQRTSHVGTLGE